jgi:hypothetical protein
LSQVLKASNCNNTGIAPASGVTGSSNLPNVQVLRQQVESQAVQINQMFQSIPAEQLKMMKKAGVDIEASMKVRLLKIINVMTAKIQGLQKYNDCKNIMTATIFNDCKKVR